MKKLFFLIAVFIGFGTIQAQEDINVEMTEPTHMDPVSVGAVLLDTNTENIKKIYIKASIMEGYHIYAHVPAGEAYISSEFGIDLPNGIELVGEWEKSSPQGYPGKNSILVYKGDNSYVHQIKISDEVEKGTNFKCWIYYQCCDVNICFPPKRKEIKLILN